MVFEPEAECVSRLLASGMGEGPAREAASYLAQSTDIAPEFDAIAAACAVHGVEFHAVRLDDAPAALSRLDRATSLVWTLTDGIAYFRGGAVPAIARLHGLPTIGSDDSLFALCQDKFRSGAVMGALGLPVPGAGLCRDGRWLVEPPAVESWFVKPNRLGAKIGIWRDSHCRTRGEAEALSRRIFAAYGDDALVQAYVAGRNVRASLLAVEPDAGMEALGVFGVETGGDFQTMEDSLALYGATGEAAKAEGAYAEPALDDLDDSHPQIAAAIRAIAARLADGLGLRDVCSLDLRVGADGAVHLIEFEVCPGLPCFDFRAYCGRRWGLSLAEAIARTAAARLVGDATPAMDGTVAP